MSTASVIWEYILRLFLSALFGGVIGLEREIRLKEAGIRTHLIVALAACLMMLVSKYGFNDVLANASVDLDPSRVAASIVTGISFLGAGTIFARGKNITGLTTAAGLWATVGIGMAVGGGMYLISAFTTVFILVIQAILHHDKSIFTHAGLVISLELSDEPEALEWLNSALAELKLAPEGIKYTRQEGIVTVELEAERLPCSRKELSRLLQPITGDPRIRCARW